MMYPVPHFTVVAQVENLKLRELSPHDTKATFHWVPPYPSIDNFRVKWWIDGQEPQETCTNIPSFTISGLSPGCHYSFQVACMVHHNGMEHVGMYSEVKSFATVHKPPSQLTVLPGLQDPSTSFLIKYHDEDPIGGYKVSVTNVLDGKTKTVNTEQLIAIADNLSPGASHSVAVVSTKNGITSQPCKLGLLKQTCPDKVTGVQSERTSATSHTIFWDSVFGADSYSVKWRKMDGNFQTVPTQETQLTLRNLDRGQVYEVRVAAVNTGGFGAISGPCTFCTDLAAPDAVTAHANYSGEDISVEVSFTAPGQQEVKEYVVTLAQDESNIEEDAERPIKMKRVLTTYAIFTQLEHGASYIPSVIAIGQNNTDSRKIFGSRIWTKPAIVKELQSKTISVNAEEIKWKEVVGALGYVAIIQEEGKEKEPAREMKENKITLRSLSLNTKFTVSIAAKNQGGTGRFSAPHVFQTGITPPTNIAVKNHPIYPENGIIATWDECNGSAQYNANIIDIKTGTKVDQQTTTKGHKEFLRNLKPGKGYKVELQAIGLDGRMSQVSCSENIWTKCSQVENLKTELVSPSVAEITWDIVEDAEKYQIIHRSSDGKSLEEMTTANRLTLKRLNLGETYTVSVQPWNKAGYGRESDTKTFRTKWAPVTEVKVSKITGDSVRISFSEPDNKPPKYRVIVESTSCPDAHLSQKVVERNYCTITGLKLGSEYVAFVWSMDPEHPNLDSVKAASIIFIAPPPAVDEVTVVVDSPTARIVTWTASPGSSSYIVKLKKTGQTPTLLPETEECEFHLKDLDLHSKYFVSVSAKNDGGKSVESKPLPFETGLHPPKAIHVSNNTEYPTTTLNVKIKEPDRPADKYQLRIMYLNGEGDDTVEITRQQARSVKKLGGLKPGISYQLAVRSLHGKDDTLNSQEIFSDVIQTKTPPMTFALLKVANDEQKINWSKIQAKGYIVKYRTQFGDWQTKHFKSHECETVLKKLEAGQVYEIKVTATNDAGQGEESQIQTFTTAPSTPTGLQSEVTSAQSIRFWCDETKGATEYNFKINGEDHWTKFQEYIHGHGDETDDFYVEISASNNGGCSLSSTALHCSQTLLKLQKKFLTKAKNKDDGFIMPAFTDVVSGNAAADFETADFSIGAGKTVCIQGTDFSGKTSIGLHHLQNIPKHLLGIFLDWDHYKNTPSSFEVKSILWEQMKEFQEHERKFALEWMKSHSDQVVFVVDNLVLPHEVTGKVKSYEDVASNEEIFYSLVTTDRQIFPHSHMLCLTSQFDLRKIINPNRALMISGFNETQINDMKVTILGAEREVILPKHLKYFCTNPSYCKLIFLLLKNPDQNVDMQSYSSIMIKLVTESVSCYADGKKEEKLSDLWKEIQSVPQKLKTENVNPLRIPKSSKSRTSAGVQEPSASQFSDAPSFVEILEENAQKIDCCANLHDYIVKALYFGLLCPMKEFKKRFHRKSIKLGRNANIWILAAGLLRERTRKLAAELFRFIGKTLAEKEMTKKLSFVKNFVADNISRIQGQVTSDSQITLDWLDIINEVEGFHIITDPKLKISVKSKHTSAEISQMASFLCQVRGIFSDYIRVKREEELLPEQRLSIDTALKQNPDEEIRRRHSGSEENFGHYTRNSSFIKTETNARPVLHSSSASGRYAPDDTRDESYSEGNASATLQAGSNLHEEGSESPPNSNRTGDASQEENAEEAEP